MDGVPDGGGPDGGGRHRVAAFYHWRRRRTCSACARPETEMVKDRPVMAVPRQSAAAGRHVRPVQEM
jgi:hypothetical protein